MFDIDYMDGRRDFTVDPVNFGDLPQLVAELHAENIRSIPILVSIEWRILSFLYAMAYIFYY